MGAVLVAAAASMASLFRSRRALQLEVLALRHQLAVYHRTAQRPRLRPADRLLWAWLGRAWSGWRDALVVVQPQTVIAWQRKRFREHWTRLSRQGAPGRSHIATEVRDLIRKMATANPSWGSPRIVGELRKRGVLRHPRAMRAVRQGSRFAQPLDGPGNRLFALKHVRPRCGERRVPRRHGDT